MADYKALPYRASKEFHQVGEQKWCILVSNEKGKEYTKPDLINFDSSKSIMGFVEGDNHFLLFQANDGLINCDGKPALAKASFSKPKDGGWDTDTVGQQAWKDTWGVSNKWVALLCDFPILKALAKWLHNNKIIISDLVYIKNKDVNESKLHDALNSLINAIIKKVGFSEDDANYLYLKEYGLEACEFEEKITRSATKLPPVEGIKKQDNGFVSYEKVLFTSPTISSATLSTGRTSYTEAQKASSRLEFMLGNADKIKQLFTLYKPEELWVALALSGANASVNLSHHLSYDNVMEKPETSPSPKESTNNVEKSPEYLSVLPLDKHLQTIKGVFGEQLTNQWLSHLTGLRDTGNPVNLETAIISVINIMQSLIYNAEPKNVITWAKNNVPNIVKSKTNQILDLDYKGLLYLAHAVNVAESKFELDSTYSILDLKNDDLVDAPAF